jgi:hypothetical protein
MRHAAWLRVQYNLTVHDSDHPARRPTRYHWEAGLSPLHWGVALAGWGTTFVLGMFSALGSQEAALMVPWLAAATLAWSGIWLFAVPNSPRFKRAVDAIHADRYANDYDYQIASLIDRIDKDLHYKVDDITRLRNRAREVLGEKFSSHDLFAKDNLEKLDSLAISYLKLAAALSEYDEYVSLVDPDGIERELETERKYAAEGDETLRAARSRHVVLLENRMNRYEKAKERIKLIQAQCRNIETTMKLLVDQAMTAADPERVGRDIDEVLENVRDSEILTAELAAYDELERELDGSRLDEIN